MHIVSRMERLARVSTSVRRSRALIARSTKKKKKKKKPCTPHVGRSKGTLCDNALSKLAQWKLFLREHTNSYLILENYADVLLKLSFAQFFFCFKARSLQSHLNVITHSLSINVISNAVG